MLTGSNPHPIPQRLIIPKQTHHPWHAPDHHAKPILTATDSKPLPRRRHTKSRTGCITCKTRRIKCGEESPNCRNCVLRGAPCRYPSKATPSYAPSATKSDLPIVVVDPVPIPAPRLVQPTSLNAVFSARELSFFHHFLTSVSHPLPIGNVSVWLREIPQIAHEYHYLMHAMLALGASEFHRANPGARSVDYDILKHRGIAIAGLNKALADIKAWNTSGYPDAILASCYTLIRQSSHTEDGLQDFEIFVHGAALVTERIRTQQLKTFLNLAKDWPQERLQSGTEHIEAQLVDFSLIRQGIAQLDRIKESLVLSSGEPFWFAMRGTLNSFLTSAVQGYLGSILSYGAWYDLAKGLLHSLRDTSSLGGVILTATFFADMILIKVLIPLRTWPCESQHRLPTNTLNQMVTWIEAIDQTLPEDARSHLDWAKTIVRLVPRQPPRGKDVSIYDAWSQAVEDAHRSASSSKLFTLEAKIEILNDIETKAHMILGDILRLGSEITSWFEEYVYTSHRQMVQRSSVEVRVPPPVTPNVPLSPTAQASPDASLLDADPYPFLIFSKLRG